MAEARPVNEEPENNWQLNNYSIEVIFCVEFENHPALCRIAYRKQNLDWLWSLDLRHFDSIFELSKLVLVIPDKIATTILIQEEQEEEDGIFLMIPIRKLVTEYYDLIKNISVRPFWEESEMRKMFTFSQGKPPGVTSNNDADNIVNILKDFLDKLETFEEQLRSRNLAEIRKTGKMLVIMSDHLAICCKVFVDYVCPVWRSIFRIGGYDTNNISIFRQRICRKLATSKCLYQEYLQLFDNLVE